MSGKHARTPRAIFAEPVRANINWSDVASLLAHLGAEISEGSGSRVRVALNGVRAVPPAAPAEGDGRGRGQVGPAVPGRGGSDAMMQYKGYVGKVEFDAEAKVLHGEVVGLRDVVTFQADSVRGVEEAFRDSVDDYLAFCKQRGEEPEKPFSGQFVIRADPDLHRRLSAIAQASGRSLNAVVVDFLRRGADSALPQAGAAAEMETGAPAKVAKAKSGAVRGRRRKPGRRAA